MPAKTTGNTLIRSAYTNYLVIISWAILAIGLRPVAPWFFWTTMILLPGFIIWRKEKSWLISRESRLIFAICGLLLLVHCTWAVVRATQYTADAPVTFWQDDRNYYREAASIAESWRSGDYPEIWRKGSLPYLGTLHIGYHRPLATAFLLFGTSTLTGLLLNAVALSLLPLMAALAARYLFVIGDNHGPPNSQPRPLHQRTSLIAAALVALHPAQFYWASYLMKDAWTAFAFMATLALLLGALGRRSLTLAVAALLLLPYLFTVRIYACVSLIAGVMLLPGLRLQRSYFISLLLGSVSILALLLLYTVRGNVLLAQMSFSLSELAPAGIDTPGAMLKQLGAGLPRLFLAPYSWIIQPEPTPMYGMYPGMWYLYLVGYPLAFCGIYTVIRQNRRLAIIPFCALGVAGLIFLLAEFGGNASRQRFYLEPVILIFAAYGIKYPSKFIIVAVLVLELLWATGQIIAMRR